MAERSANHDNSSKSTLDKYNKMQANFEKYAEMRYGITPEELWKHPSLEGNSKCTAVVYMELILLLVTAVILAFFTEHTKYTVGLRKTTTTQAAAKIEYDTLRAWQNTFYNVVRICFIVSTAALPYIPQFTRQVKDGLHKLMYGFYARLVQVSVTVCFEIACLKFAVAHTISSR